MYLIGVEKNAIYAGYIEVLYTWRKGKVDSLEIIDCSNAIENVLVRCQWKH